MLVGDSAEMRKARGAFFTPPDLASYVAGWAVRYEHAAILEPSCGEAAFLVAAGDRLAALRAASGALIAESRLVGVELHEASAVHAAAVAAERGHDIEVTVGDFLATEPTPTFDAVIGNPPYVRYQAF